ncbi:hypothetical protein OEZ86_014486 [Tetradesmus obliquus]|nr:hypothetical protein OEZ86_014486 [Tetradesmus obliquus]
MLTAARSTTAGVFVVAYLKLGLAKRFRLGNLSSTGCDTAASVQQAWTSRPRFLGAGRGLSFVLPSDLYF